MARTLWPLYAPVDTDRWQRILVKRAGRKDDFDTVVDRMTSRYSEVRRGRHDARWWVFYVPKAEVAA